jgi:hypothetical protein
VKLTDFFFSFSVMPSSHGGQEFTPI